MKTVIIIGKCLKDSKNNINDHARIKFKGVVDGMLVNGINCVDEKHVMQEGIEYLIYAQITNHAQNGDLTVRALKIKKLSLEEVAS